MPETPPPSWPWTSSELSGLGAKPRLLLLRLLQRWLLCLASDVLKIGLALRVLQRVSYATLTTNDKGA